jgi:hypothetical protein
MGKRRRAISFYEAALRGSPDKAISLFRRGKAKLKIGDRSGGDEDIKAAQALKPNISKEFASYGVRCRRVRPHHSPAAPSPRLPPHGFVATLGEANARRPSAVGGLVLAARVGVGRPIFGRLDQRYAGEAPEKNRCSQAVTLCLPSSTSRCPCNLDPCGATICRTANHRD